MVKGALCLRTLNWMRMTWKSAETLRSGARWCEPLLWLRHFALSHYPGSHWVFLMQHCFIVLLAAHWEGSQPFLSLGP